MLTQIVVFRYFFCSLDRLAIFFYIFAPLLIEKNKKAMKKNHLTSKFNSLLSWSVTMLLLSVVCLNTHAQNRRRTVTKKQVKTTVQKPAQKPVVKVNKNCAIYSWQKDVRSVQVTNDYIYYVETNDNNAVMAIDRKTGDLKTIIPGIAGIYEGARPRIYSILVCGDRLFFQLVARGISGDCGGVYVYDGKSVETSPSLYPSKRSQMYVGSDNYLLAYECDSENMAVWDVKRLKAVKQARRYNYSYDLNGTIPDKQNQAFMISDGTIWSNSSEGAKRCPITGKVSYYNIDKEVYVVQAGKGGEVLRIKKIQQAGDYIYASCKRRIYRMNLLSPGKWEEYAKMPPTINNEFEWFCADAKGNLLTRGDSREDNNTMYWKVGSFDSPQSIGRDIDTGFTQRGYTRIWENLNTNFMDADGNLVSHSGSNIYIYNPNGVVGYTNTVGKIVELEK